jgi:hypothetical protein
MHNKFARVSNFSQILNQAALFLTCKSIASLMPQKDALSEIVSCIEW